GLNLVAALGRASHSHVDWNVDGAGEGAAFVADGPLKVPDPSLGVIGRERYGRTRFGVQPVRHDLARDAIPTKAAPAADSARQRCGRTGRWERQGREEDSPYRQHHDSPLRQVNGADHRATVIR